MSKRKRAGAGPRAVARSFFSFRMTSDAGEKSQLPHQTLHQRTARDILRRDQRYLLRRIAAHRDHAYSNRLTGSDGRRHERGQFVIEPEVALCFVALDEERHVAAPSGLYAIHTSLLYRHRLI